MKRIILIVLIILEASRIESRIKLVERGFCLLNDVLT